jgi:hypothetical protein
VQCKILCLQSVCSSTKGHLFSPVPVNGSTVPHLLHSSGSDVRSFPGMVYNTILKDANKTTSQLNLAVIVEILRMGLEPAKDTLNSDFCERGKRITYNIPDQLCPSDVIAIQVE